MDNTLVDPVEVESAAEDPIVEQIFEEVTPQIKATLPPPIALDKTDAEYTQDVIQALQSARPHKTEAAFVQVHS